MENRADSDPEKKRRTRREQTTPFRINKKTVDSLKEFQAQFGDRGPSLADLVEAAWERYVAEEKFEERMLRLPMDFRQIVNDLIHFLSGKSPKRRQVAELVERMLRAFGHQTKLVWILVACSWLLHR
jgi:hypothetical protein